MPNMKPSDLLNDIANLDNLILAWRKVEGEMSRLDDWCDIMEFYAYKFTLKDNLDDLHHRLVEGRFEMQPLRPLPFPKGADSEGNKRVRQFFHVAIEDQLVWIAYCNVIAQYMERQMPGWSFGNRTDIRVWYQNNGNDRKLCAGNYRNTSGYIYKKWNYSWPRYRKLLSLTIKMMSRNKDADGTIETIDFEDYEEQLLKDNQRTDEQHLDYLDEDYFPLNTEKRLYWAGLDIEKFYPAVNRDLIKENMKKYIYSERQSEGFLSLTDKLLDFKIDTSDFTIDDLECMNLNEDGSYPKGIPTGLLVGGFLANLALLGIDWKVREWLNANHKVAHFRYVDDHVVLAQDKDSLLEWVDKYIALLKTYGFVINKEKIEPEELVQYYNKKDEEEKPDLSGLDPKYPTPLMTLTLQKVSQLADMNMEQLSKTEFDIVFADLQELLVVDISDQEIKKETRLSFAVTMLTRILVHGDVDCEELGRLKKELRKELSDDGFLTNDSKNDIWKEWFYNDDKYDENFLNDKKLAEDQLRVIKGKVSQINEIFETARKNEQRKYGYIYNLIKKTLEDVPERSRIWIRMIQFVYKYLPQNLEQVLGLLRNYSIKQKLHKLDVVYLRMMLLNKMADLMMRDIRHDSIKEGYKEAKIILKKVLDDHYQKTGTVSYFEKETITYIQYVLELDGFFHDGKNGTFIHQSLYTGQMIDSDFWMLFYLEYVSEVNEMKSLAISKIKDKIEISSRYYAPLFLKCMRDKDFQDMQLGDGGLDDALINYIKRHHLEMDVYRTAAPEHRELLRGLLDMIDAKKAPEGYITLSEWISWLENVNKESKYPLTLSHRLEYITLKVIWSLAKKMYDISNDIFKATEERHINLFNLCIKEECKSKFDDIDYWKDVKNIIEYDGKTMPVGRYPLDDSLFGSEYRDVYDIGVIMLQMLVLEHLPSDYLLDAEYGYKWERAIEHLMRSGLMSFYTYMILMACLSKRSRETIQIKNRNEQKRDDYSLDPPEIYSLKQLMEHIDIDIKLFERNMSVVVGGKNRTLAEVSLDTFRGFYNSIKNGGNETADMEDYLKIDVIQTNLDRRQAWSGLSSKGYKMTKSEMKKCWSEIVLFFKQVMELDDYARPQMVVLPEFAFDHEYYWQLRRLAQKSGCLVIAGRNFVEVPGKKLMNKAVVFVPMKWPMGKGHTSLKSFEFGKYFFAKEEKNFIKSIGYQPLRFDKMYLVDLGGYGKMGLAICADFYDLERFVIYRGKIQHLILIAYNKDVKSFYYLAEAISRILFCNVIICNTGFYGGSIAFSPYKEEYKRYVYKHEGANLYTNQIVSLPVKSLLEAQKGNDKKGEFKSLPPGYKWGG